MSAESRYSEELSRWPQAGSGVHAHLMRVCNLAALADVGPDQAEREILSAMPRTPSPGNEVEAALRKAYAEMDVSTPDTWTPRPRITPEQRQREEERRHKQAVGAIQKLTPKPMTFDELEAESPVPLKSFCFDEHPHQAAVLLLRTLYGPEELVFTGDTYGQAECIQTAYRHAEAFLSGATVPPLFIANPLTGEEGETKGGKASFRADSCIADHRFALFECDLPEITVETQAAFLLGRIKAGWPIASITYSGGKSLHALLKVDAVDAAEWEELVKGPLFDTLTRFGADPACKTAARLTRLPGHHRADKGEMQRLLWLQRPEAMERTSQPPQAQRGRP